MVCERRRGIRGDSRVWGLSHWKNRAVPSGVGRLGEAGQVRDCLGHAEFEMSLRHPRGAAQEAGGHEPGVQESTARAGDTNEGVISWLAFEDMKPTKSTWAMSVDRVSRPSHRHCGEGEGPARASVKKRLVRLEENQGSRASWKPSGGLGEGMLNCVQCL